MLCFQTAVLGGNITIPLFSVFLLTFYNRLLPLVTERMSEDGILSFLNAMHNDPIIQCQQQFFASALNYTLEHKPTAVALTLHDFKTTQTSNGLGSKHIFDRLDAFENLINATLDQHLEKEAGKIVQLTADRLSDGAVDASLDVLRTPRWIVQLMPQTLKLKSHVFTAYAKQINHRLLELMFVDLMKQRPQPPSNWARTKCLRPRCCVECDQLNAFIRDPFQQVGRWQVVTKTRQHLTKFLSTQYYTIDTDSRYGTPYILVVTKTNQEYLEELQK